MRKLTIQETVYKIPQTWEEVTVAQFDKVQAILRDKEEEEVSLKTLAKIAGAIIEMPMAILLQAPKQLFDLIIKELEFLFDGSHKTNPATTITIDGIRHTFPTSEDDISLGQWVDVDTVVKGDEVLASIMAILLLPEGEKHTSTSFKARKKKMQGLPCSDMLPLLNFFLSSGKEYTKLFQSFLVAKVGGLQHLQRLENTLINGDGFTQLHSWHKAMYLKWIMLLRNQLSKC